MPCVSSPRLPSPSSSRMLAAAAMFALVLGCQSVTNPSEDAPSPTTEVRDADISLEGGAFPDSVQVEFAKDISPIPRVRSFTPSDRGVLLQFEAPVDLGSDTLWLHLWTRGVRHQSVGFAKKDGKTSFVASRRSELASQTLARLDSLQDAGKLPPGTPAFQFLSVMGDLVVEGDATTSQWWQNPSPVGLSKNQVDSTILAAYVRRGVGIDSILGAGRISLDRTAVQDALDTWLREGIITKDRYETVMGTGTLDKSGPVVTLLSPSISDVAVESGISTIRVKIGASDPAGVAKVRIGSTVLETSPWEATVVLKEGENLVEIVAHDRLGNESSSNLRIVRRASTGDLVPPSIERTQPKADTIRVPWSTRTVDLSWKVADDSLLDEVKLGSRVLTGSEGVYGASASLVVGRNEVVLLARDRHGNETFDTLIVHRAADTTAPTLKLVQPSEVSSSAPWGTDTAEVVVHVEDDLALRTVRIAGVEVPGTAGVYRRRVALRVGSNEVLVAAVDSSDNGSDLTVKILRASDGRSPLTERQAGTADTVLPAERTEYAVAWKVTDQDSLTYVKIESEVIKGAQGVYTKTVALPGDSTWIRVDAVDVVGNMSSDSILVRRLSPPKVSPTSAAVAAAQTVSAEAGMGAEIEYALGATTSTWTSYTSALSVTSSTRVFFRARIGNVLSSTVERIYVFAPAISPAGRSFTVPETVSVAANGTAQAEYSMDGTTWSAYTKPIVVGKTTRIQARSRIGDLVSAATLVQYEHVPLTIAPASGGYSASQPVSITAVQGAALEYALGAPENWVPWTGALSIGGNSKLYARVAGTGVVTSAEYAFPPRVLPLGKSFVSPESLTVLGIGADALEYSLDGLTWSTYTRKLYLKSSMTLRVRAKVGATYSPVATQEYVYTPLRAVTGVGYEWATGSTFAPSNPMAYWLKGDSLWTTGFSSSPFAAWGGSGATGERKFLGTGYEQVWTSMGSPRLTGASTFFLKKGGELLAVGANNTGALGDGTKNDAATPMHVMDGVRSVSMGIGATMVVTTGGALYAMGSNQYGSLGLGTTAYDVALGGPTLVLASGVKQAAMGQHHSLVLKTDGTLWTAGQNWRGLRGLGEAPEVDEKVDSNFTQLMTGVRSIAANTHYSLVVKEDGSLWGFGQNTFGQLGTGDTKDVLAPFKIADGVDTVALGEWHALILKKTGDLYAIGYGAYGALGTGAIANTTTPTLVAEQVEWISAGGVASFYRTRSGWLFGAGSNGAAGAPLFPGITDAKVVSPRNLSW